MRAKPHEAFLPVALKPLLRLLIPIALALAGTRPLPAQLPYEGGIIRQDFNTLPASAAPDLSALLQANAKGPVDLAASPPFEPGCSGWSIYARAGSPLSLKVGNGSLGTPAAYSFGQTSSSDRALGSLAGSAMAANFGLRLKNSTGRSISSFTLVYTQEQWRNGGTTMLDGLTLEYRITATSEGIESGKAFANIDGTTATSNSSSAGPLDGEAPANRRQYQAKVTPASSWLPDQFLVLRWRDLDETGADNALAIDDVLFHATADGSPSAVIAASPQDGAIPVSPNAVITLDFNQPLEISDSALHLRASLSGELAFSSQWFGGMRLILTPDQPLPAGEEITLSLAADQINAAPAMSADYQLRFTVLPPADQPIPIHSIQGRTGSSPLVGREVTIEGLVGASFQGTAPALGGYCLQSGPGQADRDPLTSEGIWVDDSAPNLPHPRHVAGAKLRVTGQVDESDGMTVLRPTREAQWLSQEIPPEPVELSLPLPSPDSLEAVEGMLVRFPNALVVTRNGEASYQSDSLALYGELLLCANAPHWVSTQWLDPNDESPEATLNLGPIRRSALLAAEQARQLNSLVLDDGSNAYRPNPTPHLNAVGTRRIGDRVSGLQGLITQSHGTHRLHPSLPVNFEDSNPRPTHAPPRAGRLRLASFNLQNYFVTTGGEQDRGAPDPISRQRQRRKIAAAITAFDADLVGIIELQNHPDACPDLLAALLEQGASYQALHPPEGGYPTPEEGADVIRCQWLYRAASLQPLGPCRIDRDPLWSQHRPPLLQCFRELASGEDFIACLCHLKSKSSNSASGLDLDQGDGQGAYNYSRLLQVKRLHQWLSQLNLTEPDWLILGDLNCNAQEDPLDWLRDQGWKDGSAPESALSYSYQHYDQRGCLDHALGSPTMIPQIRSICHWHINADEPLIMSYSSSAANAQGLSRCSDHDPLLLDLTLTNPTPSYQLWALQQEGVDLGQSTADPDADGLCNLAEFLLGKSPIQPNPQPLQLHYDPTGSLQANWCQRRFFKGAELRLQASQNLLDWTTLPASNAGEQPADPETLIRRATLPQPYPNQIFLRLIPVEQ